MSVRDTYLYFKICTKISVSISVCGINEVVASVRNLIVDFVKTLQSDLSSVTRKVCIHHGF